MDIRKMFLVLIDVSGYTKFLKLHKMSLLHAERIITMLMESVIDSSRHPLTLNKLEGDAALFYATAEESREAALDVFHQVDNFFQAFYGKQKELIEGSMCNCEGCVRMGQLNLKAIVHFGEAAIKQVRQFEELAGEDVILAHRLLKNSIEKREYLLLSERVHKMLGGAVELPFEERTEQYSDVGSVRVFVHYPEHQLYARVPAKPGPWKRLAQMSDLMLYTAKRMVGRKAPGFSHLAGL
jgi:hypothetical protein